MDSKYVSNRPVGGKRDSAGIGNVIIPSGQDKNKYIQNCLRTGTISIVLESGGVIDNVLVTKSAINSIDFPLDYDLLGSQVVWVNQPRKQQPIIIGIISKTNEFINVNKETSSMRRSNKDFVGDILIDANKGIVIVNSTSTNDKSGDIYVISYNRAKTSKLNVKVSGEINIETPNFNLENSKKLTLTIKDENVDDKETTIFYEKGKGFYYKDEFDNEMNFKEDLMEIKPNKSFKIGDGKEPMMLSDTFKGIFEDFTDILVDFANALPATTVICAAPTQPSGPPVNADVYIQIAGKLEAIKTKYKSFQSNQSSLD